MMTRLAPTFARCRAANRAAFVPFVMAGDPSAEGTLRILDALVEAGADMIELGIPFSDPMADGPVIQAAGLRALKAGMTLKGVLEIAAKFRAAHPTVPLVLMGYVNPVYVYQRQEIDHGSDAGSVAPSPLRGGLGRGAKDSSQPHVTPPSLTLPARGRGLLSELHPHGLKENGFAIFSRDAAAAGVDGVIIVDLPPEESGEIEPHLRTHGIDFVRLIAPTSVPGRLKLLTENASGYLYYISIAGITGAAAASTADVAAQVAKIKAVTQLPICVGFGVKTPDDVRALAPHADGVVVGSAIVKLIGDTGGDVKKVRELTNALAGSCGRK